MIYRLTTPDNKSFLNKFDKIRYIDSLRTIGIGFQTEKLYSVRFNTLRPRQNGRHFADNIFKCIFLNENARILLNISLNFAPKFRINDIPALVQIMAWRRSGDKR